MNESELRRLVEQSGDSLYILMVRGPCDWGLSMKNKPWHLCKLDVEPCAAKGVSGDFADDSLSDFWQLPLRDWGEHRDEAYDNLFQLRTHKLRLMQQIRDALPRVKLVHMRDVEAAPNRVMVELQEEYGLTTSPRYQGAIPVKKLHRQPCLSQEEHEVAKGSIDWAVEAQFGYFPDSCRVCTTPQSES